MPVPLGVDPFPAKPPGGNEGVLAVPGDGEGREGPATAFWPKPLLTERGVDGPPLPLILGCGERADEGDARAPFGIDVGVDILGGGGGGAAVVDMA